MVIIFPAEEVYVTFLVRPDHVNVSVPRTDSNSNAAPCALAMTESITGNSLSSNREELASIGPLPKSPAKNDP